MDRKGRPRFNDLLFHRGEARFFAFDLLHLFATISSRIARLRCAKCSTRGAETQDLHYADHVSGSGVALFDRVCEMDLEGIVAKHATAPYLSYNAISTWYKIKNPRYSQMAGRHELFERERHSEPVPGWHSCDLAFAGVKAYG